MDRGRARSDDPGFVTGRPHDSNSANGSGPARRVRPEPGDPLAGVPDESLDRSERVIAISRLVLAIAAFAIIEIDPRQPSYTKPALYLVFVAYIAYSAVLFWLFSRSRLRSRTTSKPILATDIAWFTVIVNLSEAGTSAFILFYLFAVCTAAIRWGIRTTIKVAVFSSVLYLISVVAIRRVVLGPDFTMHIAHLMRPIYLILLGYLVGFIGEHELLAKRRLIEIISMQRDARRSRSQLMTLARLARHVTRFFDADYAILQLHSPDDRQIEWEGTRMPGGTVVFREIPPSSWSLVTASDLSFRLTHALGNWGRRVDVYDTSGLRTRQLTESEEPAFLARARVRSLISVPIASPGGIRGRLLIGRRRANFSKEDLDFCQTLVAQGAMILDNVRLQEAAEELAVAEERARIARDVHDGFVQSLASIDVGIEVCRRLNDKDPERLAPELADLQRTVKQGYRDARRYLDRLRQGTPQGPDVDTAVREVIQEFRERGDVYVDLDAQARGVPARHGIGFELLQIVREGLTNIHRHAAARHAAIRVSAREDDFLIVIRDDGRGFPSAPFQGDDELPVSTAPWSIRERVQSLGGSLRLRSRAGGGSEIHITLPRHGWS
jgi:signal transduction histidine kinase